MDNISIRRVTPEDLEELREIGRQTFSETFSAVNTENNMIKYLDHRFSIDKLTGELNNAESEFYFAVLGNKPIGYLKVNYGKAQTELQDDKSFEIERIYVLKEFQRRKVGQLLYEKAFQIAKNKKAGYIWLGVWENNFKALSFYRKNGFAEFDRHIFELGNSRQIDYMMRLELSD